MTDERIRVLAFEFYRLDENFTAFARALRAPSGAVVELQRRRSNSC